MKRLLTLFFTLLLLAACHYPAPDLADESLSSRTRDSLYYLHTRHYTFDTNLELFADSISLECLPVKGSYITLRRGDRVVVAEFAVEPTDSVDSVRVKLAHTQERQGWVRESDLKTHFVPTDSISQAIYLFSHTHASYFIFILALFVGAWVVRVLMRRQVKLVYFNDIDSVYPLLLCLLMAGCATLYESMQIYAPDAWEHFYFNPTLSPLQVPPIPACFLIGLWAFVVVLPAVLEVSFRQLSPLMAMLYLLGLASCCIFCYFFFILTTRFYVGYAFLMAFLMLFVRRLKATLRAARYYCGYCGGKLRSKGVCPNCGAINE